MEEIENWYLDVDDAFPKSNWFDLELGVVVGGEKINLIPILQEFFNKPDFSLDTIQSLKKDQLYKLSMG